MLPYLVEPEELAPGLTEPRLVILDICSEESWHRAHLPGALHVQPSEIVSGTLPAAGKLPGLQRLQALVRRLDLRPDQHVVVYDDEGGGWAGRMIWTLDVIGHPGHSYLNGGLIAWQQQGLPVTSAAQHVGTAGPVSGAPIKIDRSHIIDKEELHARLGEPNLVIWDARSAAEFDGRSQHAARGGHIPGAVNLDWVDTMDRKRGLRIRSDIRELLAARGITAGREIVTYCQTHHRSGLTYLIGKALGYNIRAYDGSWSEWGNDPTLPVERDPDERDPDERVPI